MVKNYVFYILFLLTSFALYATEKEIILGGSEGWDAFSVQENIARGSGRFGKEAIHIGSAAEPLTQTSDLLLDFENGETISDRAGNYTLVSSTLLPVTDTIMGDYAALGKGATGGIRLKGKQGSLFGTEGLAGSFTISFWLNPSLAENGETIFSWRSSRNLDGIPVYQMISATFFNNHLKWNFTNIFANVDVFKEIILTSTSLVIPDAWALHSVSFDEDTGLIEYRINGKIEALSYATLNGRSQGAIFSAHMGVPADIEICSQFTGRIDDFSIRREIVTHDFKQNLYELDGAYFETQPLGPFLGGSNVTGIEVISDIPSETDVQFFVRASDNFYEWSDSYPEWISVTSGENIEGVNGIWFQLAASLYTDGDGTKTPRITEVRVKYEEKEAPLPPLKVFTTAGDGYVDLSWLASAGSTADGYIVYYGEASGEYLGQTALQGDSPIDVGQKLSLRLSGLANGKIYYFAVAAYSDAPRRVEGFFSTEVYARPLR